jgi:hypothetical protein
MGSELVDAVENLQRDRRLESAINTPGSRSHAPGSRSTEPYPALALMSPAPNASRVSNDKTNARAVDRHTCAPVDDACRFASLMSTVVTHLMEMPAKMPYESSLHVRLDCTLALV